MFKVLFQDINDMDEIELEAAYNFFEKLVRVLCLFGHHDLVEDDGDVFCLNCSVSYPDPKKDNFVTTWIYERYYELSSEWHYYNDPYRDY